MSFDGQMDQLLKAATSHYNLIDINSHETDLEEIFLTYYEDEEAPV
jgi:ABC-2 type transport system ATP-binding protein